MMWELDESSQAIQCVYLHEHSRKTLWLPPSWSAVTNRLFDDHPVEVTPAMHMFISGCHLT